MLRAIANQAPGFKYAGSFTWATLPAAASYSGFLAFASNLGANGSMVISNGTRWLALNGIATLAALGNTTGNIANSETIVLQALIPAGGWQTNDLVRVRNVSMSKSGTTDTGNFTIRIGTAGTTADTAVTGASALGIISAANRSYGGEFDLKLVSATSAQKLGNSGSAPFAGSSSTAAPAATTITDASANALYVSVSIASSSTNDTVAMQSGQIQLITP